MKTGKLFSDLSSEARLAMIDLLSEDRTFTDLKNYVGISSPEISRHLRRLTKSDIIYKKSNGLYSLTSLGKIIRSVYHGVNFIALQSDFFNRHDLSVIPEYLLSRFDMLSDGEVIPLYSAMDHILKLKDNTDIYWDISENSPPVGDSESRSIWGNISSKKNIIVPSLLDSYALANDADYIRTVKILDGINFSLTINGDKGLLALPDLHGNIDRNYFLYGESPAFVDWCKELFLFYWEKADVIHTVK